MKSSSFLLITLFLAAACDDNDIGDPCVQLLANEQPSDGDDQDGRVETQEVVGQDVTFPCEELICVATAGRDGYCSKKCRDDSACPDGFECREIQPIGLFAGQQFCAWKRCETRSDCGNVDDFCCETVPNSGAAQDYKYCAFKDGKCGS